MDRAEADATEGLHHPHDGALSPELRPQRGDRAAPVRLRRHHQPGHLSARRDRRPAVLADQGGTHRHRRAHPRSRSAVRRSGGGVSGRRGMVAGQGLRARAHHAGAGGALRGGCVGGEHPEVSRPDAPASPSDRSHATPCSSRRRASAPPSSAASPPRSNASGGSAGRRTGRAIDGGARHDDSRPATGVMEAALEKRGQRLGNHGARRTTAHFPSRPKNHTMFLGLYGKVRRHPPCAVVFLARVTPLASLRLQWPRLTAQTASVPTRTLAIAQIAGI